MMRKEQYEENKIPELKINTDSSVRDYNFQFVFQSESLRGS